MGSTAVEGGARIGVNAHLLSGQDGYRRAGIHHYINQLLNKLPHESDDFRLTIFTNNAAGIQTRPADIIVPSHWPTQHPLARIMWEQLVWPVAAARHRLDLLHSMAFVTPIFSRVPAVVTVYDLSFIHYPDQFPALRRAYLTGQTRRSCQSARAVVTISESGRQDVHEHYGIPLEHIAVVPPGVDDMFRPLPDKLVAEFRGRLDLPDRFVLHVGTLQPRKNIPILIEAFASLKRPDLGLVLVGGRGWSYDEIDERVKDLNLQEQVRFAGYVPDADLPLWYNAAALLVFPSVYEGFGMPIIEALACGTPVVAAKTSALAEAAGDAGLFFKPQDVTTLAEHMAIVLDDSQTAATMREKGLLYARNFSWKLSGQKMISVYKQVLEVS